MDGVSRERIRYFIRENEASLRASFRGEPFPADWEKELASLPRKSAEQELLYYARIKHYYWVRYQEERRHISGEMAPEKERAALELVTRTPVRIWIAGRHVDVTFRGMAALIALARHDLARRDLDLELADIARLRADVLEQRNDRRIGRMAARRRIRRLRRIHDRFLDEREHHTQVILANSLTPDGAAVPPDEASGWLARHAPWWNRMTAADEQRLLLALFQAGPARIAKLGPPPRDDDEPAGRRAWVEDFRFHSLYAWFCNEHGLSPADWENQDVAQFIALRRIGQPYIPPLPKREGAVH